MIYTNSLRALCYYTGGICNFSHDEIIIVTLSLNEYTMNGYSIGEY